MKRWIGVGLALLLGAAVVAAVVVGNRGGAETRELTLVRGVIGSEKKPFFDDRRVRAVFAEHGLRVEVDTAGSRQIAASVDLRKYGFAFPSSAPAAEKIKRDRGATHTFAPFSSPMAIATFEPIADVLAKAGVVRDSGQGYRVLDIKKYLDLVVKGTRWDRLPGNTAYPARKRVLLTTTDIRTSNSAAMYLSIAGYVANGDDVITSSAQGTEVAGAVAPLFLDQGYSETSTEAPFEDYLGMGKTPMVMIYEAQYASHLFARDGLIRPDMRLLYPSPTVLSKHTLLPPPDLAFPPLRGETTVSDLVLSPPEPVAKVPVEKAATMLPVPEGRGAELAEKAGDFAEELSGLDPRSPEFTRKVHDITSMGDSEIRASSQVANRMLKRPVAALASARGEGKDPQAVVAGQLTALRRTIVDLDPKQASSPGRKLLGLIPFGNKLRDYFAKYQSAQRHIDDIIRALKSGQDELRKDNAAIEGEKADLWESMKRLQEYALLAAALDAAVEDKIMHVEAADPEKATALRSDALFGIRQKHQDLLTQLAVSAQGYLALDLIRRNNLELIKGVDRATTTTIAALRTAVTVAQALANQKLVLDQITTLNATTSDLIVATSEMLRTQAADIQTQAASTTVDMDALRKAFDNVYSTMDMIDTFKAKAVENMAITVDSLTVELDHARTYLERSRHDGEGALPR